MENLQLHDPTDHRLLLEPCKHDGGARWQLTYEVSGRYTVLVVVCDGGCDDRESRAHDA